jgi:hypothetical protein
MRLLCLTLLAFSISAQAEPVIIEFRGVALETPLSTFRTLAPLPTLPTQTGTHAPLVELACTDDAIPAWGAQFARISDWEKPFGVVRCGYIQKLSQYSDLKAWPDKRFINVPLSVVDLSITRYEFSFMKQLGDAEPVLYEISLTIPNFGIKKVTKALANKFGQPIIEDKPVGNSSWVGTNSDHCIFVNLDDNGMKLDYVSYRRSMAIGQKLRDQLKREAGL